MNDTQPGQLIVPHSSDNPELPANGTPEPDRPPEAPEVTPAPSSSPETAAVDAAEPSVPQSGSTDIPSGGTWQFGTESEEPATGPQADVDDISWTASEFIAHQKSHRWYGALALIGLAVAALVYLVTKDKISTTVVLIAAVGFGLFAGRQPKTVQYTVGVDGIQIANKIYRFQDFKTFSVAEDGAVVSIVFMPLKRFMPSLTLYVAPDVEEQVVNLLSACLPFEHYKADAVDSLLKRIRF